MNEIEIAQLELIKQYTEKNLGEDKTGHDMTHIFRVVRSSKKIQAVEGGNLFLVLAGAYLHDVMDDKLVATPEIARVELLSFLKALGLSDQECQHLFEIIDNVSFSYQLGRKQATELSLEAKIVQDADRLDAIGAIGIGRTFYYGGKQGHEMYNADISPRENMTKEDYRINQTVINHFFEKLFKLKELMQTETGNKLAERRHQLMELFVADFIKDWED